MSEKVKFSTHGHPYIGVQSPTGLGLEATSTALYNFVQNQKEPVRTHVLLTGTYWEDSLLAYWGTINETCSVPIIRPGSDKLAITVERKGVSTVIQVPMGLVTMKIPSKEDGAVYEIQTQVAINGDDCDEPYVSVTAKAPGLLSGVVGQFEEALKKNIASGKYSKIKGNIISMTFPYRRGAECFSMNRHTARYESCTMVHEDLVFNDRTQRRIQTQLLQRIKKKDTLIRRGVPFNSTHMLVGGYGTGKTALIAATLNLASHHGFTCIFVKDARDLVYANEFVAQYEPAILVVEDVNRLMESEDDQRSVEQDALTSVLDGISSKDRHLMTIFTVNDTDRILPVFLRPGRMTSLIEMEDLEPPAAVRLLRKVCRLAEHTSQEWLEVLKVFGPLSPSTIASLGQAGSLLAELGDRREVSIADIVEAHASMALQLKLVSRPKTCDSSDLEKAAKILAAGVVEGVSNLSGVSNSAAALAFTH